MRLEQIPLFIGVVVAILGLGMVLDAQLPEGFSPSRERRRRERVERHRLGETLVGIGVMSVAAALIGRDTWRFGTVAVLAGAVIVSIGGWLNRHYLAELFAFRGVARRGEKRSAERTNTPAPTAAAPRSAVEVVPGIADAPPRRQAPTLRGDREAPIMTAADGPVKRSTLGDDTPPEGNPRIRIR